jgi:hypothetical protein
MRHVLLVFALIALSVTYLIATPQHGASNMSMMQSCPMKVAGADVALTDTTNGVAVNITTKTGDVADLRRRTESMATMHAQHSAVHGEMMPFDVKYEEISDGARLTLTPKDPAKLDEFRARVRQHVEQMKTGNCSMMQGMMQGMMPGTPKPEAKTKPEEDHSAHHPGGENK